jgi:RNA polymerase sigma-70 factor (ECF subfamily)
MIERGTSRHTPRSTLRGVLAFHALGRCANPHRVMDLATQPSLIVRLSTASQQGDWALFYEKYAAVIVSFAQKQGLDPHGARDALQETMLVVMRKLPAFTYDPARGRFRNWLLSIVANKVREAQRRARRESGHVSLDAEPESGEALHERLAAGGATADAAVEDAWRQSLLEEALRRLLEDPHTKPETIAVFRACALESRPVAEVAAQFGLKENAVYQIKNRLMTRLRALLAEVEDGAEPNNDDEPA